MVWGQIMVNICNQNSQMSPQGQPPQGSQPNGNASEQAPNGETQAQ